LTGDRLLGSYRRARICTGGWQTLRGECLNILLVPQPFRLAGTRSQRSVQAGGTLLTFSSDIHSLVPLHSAFRHAMLNQEHCQMAGELRPVRGSRQFRSISNRYKVRIEIAVTHSKQTRGTNSNRHKFRGSPEQRGQHSRRGPGQIWSARACSRFHRARFLRSGRFCGPRLGSPDLAHRGRAQLPSL
jgi:hypothetical protein